MMDVRIAWDCPAARSAPVLMLFAFKPVLVVFMPVLWADVQAAASLECACSMDMQGDTTASYGYRSYAERLDL